MALYMSYLLSLGGTALVATAVHFMVDYGTEASNPQRNEYVQGALMAAFLALMVWMLVAALAAYARRLVSRKRLVMMCAPAAVLGVGLASMYLLALVIDLVGGR